MSRIGNQTLLMLSRVNVFTIRRSMYAAVSVYSGGRLKRFSYSPRFQHGVRTALKNISAASADLDTSWRVSTKTDFPNRYNHACNMHWNWSSLPLRKAKWHQLSLDCLKRTLRHDKGPLGYSIFIASSVTLIKRRNYERFRSLARYFHCESLRECECRLYNWAKRAAYVCKNQSFTRIIGPPINGNVPIKWHIIRSTEPRRRVD